MLKVKRKKQKGVKPLLPCTNKVISMDIFLKSTKQEVFLLPWGSGKILLTLAPGLFRDPLRASKNLTAKVE